MRCVRDEPGAPQKQTNPAWWGAGAVLGIVLLFNAMVGDLSDDLLEATESGHPESVAVILDQKDLSRDAVYENGDEALFLAVENGEEEIARMLINAGANVNAKFGAWRSARTSLRLAAERGHTEIVQILLDAGADLSDDQPLWLAARAGNTGVVQTLLDAGANLSNDQPLWVAARAGNTDVVQTLLDALYERNILTDRYITPALDEAVKYGHRGIVQILKEAREKAIEKQPSAPEENKTAPLARSFTVTGGSCEIRGDIINISAGRDASTYPLPQDCALTPQASGG